MSAGSDRVVALRRLLDERFPPARRHDSRRIPTGVPAVDDALGGGLQTGTLTEFVSEHPSAGCQLSVATLLGATRDNRQRVALVDAARSFYLEGFDDQAVAHLVWVRCESLDACWRAADLVARDPNYAVVMIDVRGFPERVLLRVRASIWARLQRACEQAGTALLVQTTTALVPNAARRLAFSLPLPADALTTGRADLIAMLPVELKRQRHRARELTG